MKPTVSKSDARRLYRLLQGRGFVKAKDIEMPSRAIRAICAEYPDEFLSTQQGYKVVREASDFDIDVAVADLHSRCKHMNRRANALERVLQTRRAGRLQRGDIDEKTPEQARREALGKAGVSTSTRRCQGTDCNSSGHAGVDLRPYYTGSGHRWLCGECATRELTKVPR